MTPQASTPQTSPRQTRHLTNLIHLLRFQSVSADSRYKPDIEACAQYLVDYFTKIGLASVKKHTTPGHPIITAEWGANPQKPTVLIYGHYDVQPPDPLNLWDSPPFDPTIRDGNLYARGASDDKGQFWCHIAAIEDLLTDTGELPVNVKLLIEGEEEIGSPNLIPFVEAHKDMLAADVAIVSDTPMYDENHPSICISLRGMLYVELQVTGPKKDLHSGQLGGVVRNPIQALAMILTRLKDDHDRVLIPGFYDTVNELPADIKAQIKALPYNADAEKKELGVTTLIGDPAYTENERRWFRPTLDCNGIVGGYIGEGAKTIIPSKASAKLSMRLVASQNPTDILAKLNDYLPTITPSGVTATLHVHSMAHPGWTDPTSPYVNAGLNAIETAFKKPAVIQGEGGTIPIMYEFKRVLGIDTILMGFNLAHDNIHSPNEKFKVDHFFKGIDASRLFLSELTKMS